MLLFDQHRSAIGPVLASEAGPGLLPWTARRVSVTFAPPGARWRALAVRGLLRRRVRGLGRTVVRVAMPLAIRSARVRFGVRRVVAMGGFGVVPGLGVPLSAGAWPRRVVAGGMGRGGAMRRPMSA